MVRADSKIHTLYVAGSWKRVDMDEVHDFLQKIGYLTHDPRRWHKDKDTTEDIARKDLAHLRSSDAVVLTLPSGNSSHIEAGLAKGLGLPVYVLCWTGNPEAYMEEDAMYHWFDWMGTKEDWNG